MISLYVHVPFCRRKCAYCDFVSYADRGDAIEPYVDAVVREIAARAGILAGGVATVYFGGGTPSLLSPGQVSRILGAVRAVGPLARDCEITLETNPGTAGAAALAGFRAAGVTRLSVGAQSFDDRFLARLGRIHRADDTIRLVSEARAAGFDNIGLDLIFALPGQTPADWRSDLRAAISLRPEHVSTYNLQIEDGTPLAAERARRPDTLGLPDEDAEAAMFEDAISLLRGAGYRHYEISNFARPGRECRHNIVYWSGGEWLGIGAAAHSHLGGGRSANTADLDRYIALPGEAEAETVPPDARRERSEAIFMGLRLLDGIPAGLLDGRERETAELAADGLLARDGGRVRLTERGVFLANRVFERFV